MATFQCDIVSAEKEIFSGNVEQLIAAGVAGDLGILRGHAPLLTELKPGPVRVIQESGEEELYYVTGGFLEVQPNVVSVLADTPTRASDLDEAEAEQARQHALASLNEKQTELDYARAAAELAEATAQLRTLQQLRRRGGRG